MQGEKVMPESSNREIDRLRIELIEAKSARSRWISLIDKREILEAKIENLEHEIENQILTLHQRQVTHPDSVKTLFEEVENKKNLLKELKDKRQELDKLLDILEMNTEDFILGLQNHLIDKILEDHPNQKVSLDHITLSLNNSKVKQKAMDSAIQIFERLEEHLRQALETRNDIKRRGIFSYIFGPSPNWVITNQLHAAEALISAALAKMNEVSITAGFSEGLLRDYNESLAFLEELQAHCKKRWGFRHIDSIITIGMKDLQTHLARLKAHQKEIQASIELYQAKLEDWLNQK